MFWDTFPMSANISEKITLLKIFDFFFSTYSLYGISCQYIPCSTAVLGTLDVFNTPPKFILPHESTISLSDATSFSDILQEQTSM